MCAILTDCTRAPCFSGGPALLVLSLSSLSRRQDMKVNSKSSSITPRPRSLAAWLLGAFLLAAIDRTKGQTLRVSRSELARSRR